MEISNEFHTMRYFDIKFIYCTDGAKKKKSYSDKECDGGVKCALVSQAEQ